MRTWPLAARAVPLGAAAGALGGGFELLRVAMGSPLPLGAVEGAVLALVAVVLGAVPGAIAGLGAGVGVALACGGLRSPSLPKSQAAALGLSGAALGLFHMAPIMALKLEQGLPAAAASLGLANVGIFGVLYFNAAYWLRREEVGERLRWGWCALAPAAGLVLGWLCAATIASRSYGSPDALEDDPSVIVVTIEGLGAGSGEGTVAMPALDALGAEGVRYTQAIVPAPLPALAVAGVMTGLHPARLGLRSEGHRLARGPQTLAERLRAEGWAAGAFVGSLSVSADSGLDRGFAAYDDLLGLGEGLPAGVEQLRVVDAALSSLRVSVPDVVEGLRWRADAETVTRALGWLGEQPARPALLWVHLAGPAGGASASETDAALAQLRAGVDAWRGARPVLWAVAGTGGPTAAGDRLGGLSEAHLLAPIVVLPHKLTASHRVIDKAVRLTDLGPTVLDRLGLKFEGKVEGVDLLGFAEGTKTRGYATLLYAPQPGGSVSWGMRTPTADGGGVVKLIVLPEGERMFDVSADPQEQHDLTAAQPAAAASLRALITQEQAKNAESAPVGDRPRGVRAALGLR